LFKVQGTQLKYNTAYHLETDGQTEVVNRPLESYLCYFVSDYPRRWYMFLHLAEFRHNSTFHSAPSTVNRRSSQKLSKRFFGPFKIIERIGAVAYHLELPPDSKIHSVVHILLLRPYYEDKPQEHFQPLHSTIDHRGDQEQHEGTNLEKEEEQLSSIKRK